MARPGAASGQQLRPPSRVMNAGSQSSSSRLASSTSAYRTNSTQNGYNRPFSQSSNQVPRGHSRSKSHITGYRQSNNSQDQQGATQQQGTNGMKPFSISTFSQCISKSKSRSASLAVSIGAASSIECHVCPRSYSDPLPTRLSPVRSSARVQDESSEDSSLASAFQAKLVIRTSHPEYCNVVDSTNHVPSRLKTLGPPKKRGVACNSKLPQLSPPKSRMQVRHPLSPSQTTMQRNSHKKASGLPNSPTKPFYLSKDSNLTHPDWDDNGIGSRVAMMETMFHALKGQMEGTTFERSSTKELIDTMKTRSK